MTLSSHAYRLLEAFEQPACPICRLTLDSVHHYLDSTIYEYVNKPATHEAVRAARGFCPTHAWHIQNHINASALGVAVLYEGVIRHMLNDMGRVGADGGKRQVTRAAAALQPKGPCPACTHQAIVEEHLLRNLLEHLEHDTFTGAFSRSAGICLPHLRQALELPGLIRAKAHLLAIQQDIWSRLQFDLSEFMRKYDYNSAHETMGVEADSPRRTIEQLSGSSGIR
ncbi:MAG: hypothetical protein JW966_11615 [Anaerolineae bacterium]|nr:hypothetical protein [Anaerolineae bacterium]